MMCLTKKLFKNIKSLLTKFVPLKNILLTRMMIMIKCWHKEILFTKGEGIIKIKYWLTMPNNGGENTFKKLWIIKQKKWKQKLFMALNSIILGF